MQEGDERLRVGPLARLDVPGDHLALGRHGLLLRAALRPRLGQVLAQPGVDALQRAVDRGDRRLQELGGLPGREDQDVARAG